MLYRVLIFLFIIAILDWYVFQAFRQLFAENTNARTIASGIYGLLSVLCITYILLSVFDVSDHWNRSLNIILRAIVFIVIFSKLPPLVLLIIDDLRRAFVGLLGLFGSGGPIPGRSDFMIKFGMILGAIPFTSLLYGLIRNPYRYKVHNQKIGIKNLPPALEGLKIVQISDIHSGSFTFKEPVKRAVEIINGLKADFVFFTGDLVNSIAEEMERFVDVFDKIEAKNGVFSIMGNHDYGDYYRWENKEEKEANTEQFRSIHKRMGWDLLLNENRILDIQGQKLAVIGVENISGKLHFRKYGDLAKAYQGCEDCALKILLSHDPSHWSNETIKEYKDIDITLSGHTHGMQFGIEIPGWLKWSPIKYVYKEWAGLYQEGQQYLYVNRGLGFLGYPGRVGILPEITLIELESIS